jgi:hypothetical protein
MRKYLILLLLTRYASKKALAFFFQIIPSSMVMNRNEKCGRKSIVKSRSSVFSKYLGILLTHEP